MARLSCEQLEALEAGDLYVEPGFPFCPPNQGFYTPTRLSARQISSSHIVPLPAEAALDAEPTRAPVKLAALQERHGVEVDEATQSLIDQATEAVDGSLTQERGRRR